MFQPVSDSNFVTGEHSVLKFWEIRQIFRQLRQKERRPQAMELS
jgi:hypothetical protein